MIMPVFTYCGVLRIELSETKMNQLNAFHDRRLKNVYDGEKSNEGLPSVRNANNILLANFFLNALTYDRTNDL